MKVTIFALLFLFPFFFSHSFAQNLRTYSYRVRIAMSDGSCDAEAAQMLTRFKTLTRVLPATAQCSDLKDLNQRVVTIFYQAPMAIPRYAALFGASSMGQTPTTTQGGYANYEGCMADISHQRVLFERETGLPALAAYCEPGLSYVDSHFILHIDGFGTPRRQLYVFSAYSILTGERQFTERELGLFRGQDADIVKNDGKNVYYYAEKPLPLNHVFLGAFDSASDCQRQLDDARSMFRVAGERVVLDCRGDIAFSGRVAMSGIQLGYGLLTSFLSESSSEQRYLSIEECLSDRTRLILEKRYEEGHALGVICRPAEHKGSYSAYVLTLL